MPKAQRTHKVSAKVGSYSKDGKPSGEWRTIGHAVTSDNGAITLFVDTIPAPNNLKGLNNEHANWVFNLFPLEDEDKPQAANPRGQAVEEELDA